MPAKEHVYESRVLWTGAEAGPAITYKGYSRDHLIQISGKPDLNGSADPGFLGDASRHNPEDLLVASLSACHMLWYLHLCTANAIEVHAYEDNAIGTMAETPDGGGRFTSVCLNPVVLIAPSDKRDVARALHKEAHEKCFIANSVNFPVEHRATIKT